MKDPIGDFGDSLLAKGVFVLLLIVGIIGFWAGVYVKSSALMYAGWGLTITAAAMAFFFAYRAKRV